MILEYFKKHSHLVKENHLLLKSQNDAEAIHNFRLSLKRTKVILQFIELLTDNSVNARDNIVKFKSVFKRAGRIRDLQVQRELFFSIGNEKRPVVLSYTQYLEKREIKQYGKLKAILDTNDLLFLEEFRNLIEKELKVIDEATILHKGNQLIKNKYDRVKEIYYSSDDKIRFHAIRTLIKDIYYLGNMLDEKVDIEKVLHISHLRLNELGSMFGSWHDKVNAVMFLNKFLIKNPEKEAIYADLLNYLKRIQDQEFVGLDNVLIRELLINQDN